MIGVIFMFFFPLISIASTRKGRKHANKQSSFENRFVVTDYVFLKQTLSFRRA